MHEVVCVPPHKEASPCQLPLGVWIPSVQNSGKGILENNMLGVSLCFDVL